MTISDKVDKAFGKGIIAQAVVDAETRADFVKMMNAQLLCFPNATPRRAAQVSRALWKKYHGLRLFYEAGDIVNI